MREGQTATFVALVLAGELEVVANGEVKRKISAGSAVGYAALFQSGEREADVIAKEAARAKGAAAAEAERAKHADELLHTVEEEAKHHHGAVHLW